MPSSAAMSTPSPQPEPPSTPDAVFTGLLGQLAEAGRVPPRAPATPPTPGGLAVALFGLVAGTGAALFSVWASENPSVTRLPLPADAAEFLEALFRQPGPALFQGQLVLLTGAPRTGRSTTLRALMDALPDHVQALAAVEEPKRGAGGAIGMVRVGQTLSVAQAVRSFLRQDPDLLFADEVRTLEDLQLPCNGALTGHAVACVLEAKTPEEGLAWLTEAIPDVPMRPRFVHHSRDAGAGAFTMSLHETKPTADDSALHAVPWTPPG